MSDARSSAPASPVPPSPRSPDVSAPWAVPADDDFSLQAVDWRARRGMRIAVEGRSALHELREGLAEVRDGLAAWGARFDAFLASLRAARKWFALGVGGLVLAYYVPRFIEWLSTLHH